MLNYLTCKHQVYIINKYTHERMLVPCGKCSACRIKKAFRSKTLLDLDMKDFRYKVFVTLTFNDAHLSTFDVASNLDLFDDDVISKSKSFLNYCNYQVGYFDTGVFQLFIKNLRYEFQKYSSENLHYWFATEFGPTRFRPHAHGIFFFNSEEFSEVVESVIPSCWVDKDTNESRGFVDVQFVAANASNYVSQYVNCALCLPPILETKFFKPRRFSSRTSAEGSYSLTKKDVIQIILSEYQELTFWSYSGNESAKPVFLWRLFKDRWYPKCRGFSRLSNLDRKFMYRLSQFFGKQETFNDFYDFLLSISPEDETYTSKYTYQFIQREFRLKTPDNRLIYDVNALRNAFYLSRKFLRNIEYLNTKFDIYLQIVLDFWSKQELKNIKDFWSDFENFCSLNNSYSYAEYLRASLLLYDPMFVSRRETMTENNFFNILNSFGYDSVNFNNQLLDAQQLLDNLRAIQNLRYTRILENSHKNRSKNEFITNQILNNYE